MASLRKLLAESPAEKASTPDDSVHPFGSVKSVTSLTSNSDAISLAKTDAPEKLVANNMQKDTSEAVFDLAEDFRENEELLIRGLKTNPQFNNRTAFLESLCLRNDV